MMKIKILLFLLLPFAFLTFVNADEVEEADSAPSTKYNLAKICDKDLTKKTAFFESTKKKIQEELKKIKRNSPEWDDFQDSEQYEWLRFATVKGLPEFASAKDDDDCTTFYFKFILESKPLTAREKLESWKACLRAEYKEEMPAMAKRLMDCHESSKTVPATSVLKPEEKAKSN